MAARVQSSKRLSVGRHFSLTMSFDFVSSLDLVYHILVPTIARWVIATINQRAVRGRKLYLSRKCTRIWDLLVSLGFRTMEDFMNEEREVPSGLLMGIIFGFAPEDVIEKISVMTIDMVSEVTDPKLGLPNPSSQCSTCSAKDFRHCEGHFGVIKLQYTIIHPYFLSEVVQVLNNICPGCKNVKKEKWVKVLDSRSSGQEPKGCKYCFIKGWYPSVKFKVSSNDLFKRSVIIAEVKERVSRQFQKRNLRGVLPADYWNFIPKDDQQEDAYNTATRRVLSPAQVRYLLNDVDPKFIKRFVSRTESLFLNCFPVTPNNHRVAEVTYALTNGHRLVFDERTRAYKKLVDFRGIANELSSRVLDCLKFSKINSEKPVKDLDAAQEKRIKDTATSSSGLRWIKDVVLGKRSDHCFRMVVVGDPNIKLSEVGIPCHVAERLQVSENLNAWNMKKLSTSCFLRLVEKGELFVRRNGHLVRVRHDFELHIGDTIYRPLSDGDIILINRPPSIHQHSLIALTARVLPVNSVISLNPLCCSPFRGDFDGDCFHGYVPQSVDARVELKELVSLDRQLINGQTGRNLLSLSHDSLTAAHLVLENGVFLDLFEIQQLQMSSLRQLPSPAIVKSSSPYSRAWTGKQLFSMLLPRHFNYETSSNSVDVKDGELVSSEGSFWLRDTNGNIFQNLVEYCEGRTLDFLYAAQDVLCEWLSDRGFTVSLEDLYLSADLHSQKNMMDDIFYGLREADQTCQFEQLMVDAYRDLLTGESEDDENPVFMEVEQLCHEKQKSAALSQAAVDAFKYVFRDIQSLLFKYASKDNSFLTMFKAGSKGNLIKLVQHSMCLGLQHSHVPLSFAMPHQLSCSAWNNQKAHDFLKADGSPDCSQSYIPYAVVENSFLRGLNPLECFVHSVTNRDSSFSDNADLPGTLTRRLMFFMRDLSTAYDGTVRNAYGNQIVQFLCDIDLDSSTLHGNVDELFGDSDGSCNFIGGQPLGSLSACAISEAAYSALDQPISLLEASPLLNLKKVLECGSKRNLSNQTFSLFFSEKLRKQRHGFEYGALEVKKHLERVTFADVVSSVMIFFSPQTYRKPNDSPWVCHFHLLKENVRKRRLSLRSIMDSLHTRCNISRNESIINSPVQIACRKCAEAGEDSEIFCFTANVAENSKNSTLPFESVHDLLVPYLLATVISGFKEIKKVDILWSDRSKVSKPRHDYSGELYLRVEMSGECGRTRPWAVLMDNCLQIVDMIDWSRSHPDNIHDFCLAHGIDAGWHYFLKSLDSAISDSGKTVLPEHLLLATNCLSATGEFVGLNATGVGRQRDYSSIKSPFMQACLSNPGASFIKAAKGGVSDDLHGSLDSLAWGKVPPMGTGSEFELIYSGKDHTLDKPVDVFEHLRSHAVLDKEVVKVTISDQNKKADKFVSQLLHKNGVAALNGCKKLDSISKSFLREVLTRNDVMKLSKKLKSILHKYPINHRLNEVEKTTLLTALYFHPRRDEKMGAGAQDFKVGRHAKYENTRCFTVVRTDGSVEDFSYRKCVFGALEIIAPKRAKSYQSKWLNDSDL